MINVVIFDPIYNNDRLTEFKSIASQLKGWRFQQLSFAQSQLDPVAFLKIIYDTVDSADILLCFGDFFWFKFCDGVGPELIERIEKKLREGTPLFMQLIRVAEGLKTGQHSSKLTRLLRHLELIPTVNKIFSDVDANNSHCSGSSIWLRHSDGCLMNPQVLRGIEKVLIASANELEYFDNAFPLIQVGDTHFLVDDEDNCVAQKIGHRATVAVERRTDTELAIIIAGDVARDKFETVGGIIDGITENREFITRIIEHLSASVGDEEKRMMDAYKLFNSIERNLSIIVTEVISKKTNGHISSAIPETVRQNIGDKDGTINFARASFDDITKILYENWDEFADVFGSATKKPIRKHFEKINHGVRRHLMHPHKAVTLGYTFPIADIRHLDEVNKRVELAKKKWQSRRS